MKTFNVSVTVGTCLYDEASKIAKWSIGKLGTDKRPQLTGSILKHAAGTGSAEADIPCVQPLQLQWKVPTASVSGLAIASLQLSNETYKPYKGMRTMSQSGKFIVRC